MTWPSSWISRSLVFFNLILATTAILTSFATSNGRRHQLASTPLARPLYPTAPRLIASLWCEQTQVRDYSKSPIQRRFSSFGGIPRTRRAPTSKWVGLANSETRGRHEAVAPAERENYGFYPEKRSRIVRRRGLAQRLVLSVPGLFGVTQIWQGHAQTQAAGTKKRDLTFLYFADPNNVTTTPRSKSNRRTCNVAITHLRDDRDNEIYLIGTAHISNSSAQLASQVIDNVGPDVIMVELDAKRIGAVSTSGADNRTGDGDESQVKEKPTLLQKLKNAFTAISHPKQLIFGAIIGKLISRMYQGMGDEGFTVGGEFIAAFDYAQREKVPVLLGDRPIDDTFKRLAEAASASDMQDLLTPNPEELQQLGFDPTEDTSSASQLSLQIEQLKNRETVEKLQAYMQKKSPELYDALIGERDLYMAASLKGAVAKNYKRIVGVVGFAHLGGIEQALAKEANFKRVDMCAV